MPASLAPLLASAALLGSVWDYVQQYQVGVDYTSSYTEVKASYADEQHARHALNMEGARSSGYGLFLQQAFRRQGEFYFKPDLGFGVRYLNGKAKQGDLEPPLSELSFSLLAVVVDPYIKVGITPAGALPDVFLSLGPAAQVALGKVSVNGRAENAALATSSGSLVGGFFELEIVFLRFGDGALSVDAASDVTGAGRGTKLYREDVDGLSDFRADFNHSVSGGLHGFGLKLVTPWP